MKFRFQNSPYFPSYGKNWPSYSTKRKDNFIIGPAFTHFYLLKMKLHNPVCLTFCVVTWSIFHIGRKVRWVLKSKFHGLSNGYQKFLCTCSRTRENNKNKVKSDLWDTLYIHRPLYGQNAPSISLNSSNAGRGRALQSHHKPRCLPVAVLYLCPWLPYKAGSRLGSC